MSSCKEIAGKLKEVQKQKEVEFTRIEIIVIMVTCCKKIPYIDIGNGVVIYQERDLEAQVITKENTQFFCAQKNDVSRMYYVEKVNKIIEILEGEK